MIYALPVILHFRLQYAVFSVVALIDYVDLAASFVTEHEERVTEKIHLQNGLFHRHGLNIERFALCDLDLFIRLIVIFIDKLELLHLLRAFQTCLVLADLSAECGDNVIQSLIHFKGGSLCTVDHAALLHGDLNGLTISL